MPNFTVPVGGTMSFVVHQPNNTIISNFWFAVHRPDGRKGPTLQYTAVPTTPSTDGATRFFSNYVFQAGDVFIVDYRELRIGSNVITHTAYIFSADTSQDATILSYVTDLKSDLSNLATKFNESLGIFTELNTYVRSSLSNIWSILADKLRGR